MNGVVGVGMGGDIVEDAVGGGKVVLGGVGLVGRKKVGRLQKDRKVQSSCIEEQGSNHLLDSSLFCERDWGRGSDGGWKCRAGRNVDE